MKQREEVKMSNIKFEEFNISEEILKAINNLGYKNPSEVQAAGNTYSA